MGEVYKAEDTRLDRIVAIKILPNADPDLKQRFEREAKAIAALTHPHICTLHDVGHQEGTDYLVLEYLEGETLTDRLKKGALSRDQALEYAIQIADALDKAHRHGITHRDLKPGNVMLTKSGAKLLDFGLAKSAAPAVTTTGLSMLPTMPPAVTAQGMILGTLQYMAPEQLEGKEADARTDIFALGCVLYEMLTGRRAFPGDSHASVIAAILGRDPAPIAKLQPGVTAALDHIVRRTLAKAPDDRFQTARDLLLELKWVAEERPESGTQSTTARPATRERLLTTLLTIASIAALGVAALHFFERVPVKSPGIFDVLLPDDLTFESWSDSPVVSPDGRLVVFSASRAGPRQLWVRPLDSRSFTPLQGTEGGFGPFWSADSRSVAFFAAGKLKRVAAAGGPVVTLCDSETSLYSSGSWNSAGVILLSAAPGVIYRVTEAGGVPQALTKLAPGERDHTMPAFLPDGRRFLYVVSGGRPGLSVASLDGSESTRILDGASMAAYADPGYLLFTTGQTLLAQRFDPQALQLRDAPVPLVADVFWSRFSVSRNGVLAYRPASAPELSRFVWISRDGNRLGVVGGPGPYVQMTLSPSGRKLAIQRREEGNNHDLWLLDLASSVLSRLTSDPADDSDPVWSPDERSIVFSSRRTGILTLFQKDLTTGKEELLLADPPPSGVVVDDWSPDGRFVIMRNLGRAI
jgi:serine/threonine protein kinase